jgi:hypothetical protein
MIVVEGALVAWFLVGAVAEASGNWLAVEATCPAWWLATSTSTFSSERLGETTEAPSSCC